MLKRLIDGLADFFFAVGVVSTAGFIGLWFSGLFDYLAAKFPDSWIAIIFG